jgi:hypothetical protein
MARAAFGSINLDSLRSSRTFSPLTRSILSIHLGLVINSRKPLDLPDRYSRNLFW